MFKQTLIQNCFMRKLVYSILGLSLIVNLFTWVSCHKSDSLTSDFLTASVQGRVVDELGKPVNSATVKSGSLSTSTDINGVFRFDNVPLNKKAAFVSIEKSGYFKTGRTFLPHAGVLNYIEARLMPKTLKGSFSSSGTGNVTIQTGVSVSFPANGFVTSNNSSYSGTVNFYGGYIDPTSPQLLSTMPGNLTGVNTSNQMQLLQTYGMVVGELEGSSGEKLKLASGNTATITMAIPASMQGSAPATIPLWWFDESTGLWKEEGTATKQGSNYVGTVSHFSFWNCDVPNNYVTLTMTLQNQNAQPLQGYKVVLTNTSNNSSAGGYTDQNGVVSGAVPPNVVLQMKVYDKCNNVIHTQNIGPFSSNTNLGVITITTNPPSTVVITGNVVNCSSAAVTNGYVDVLLDGHYFRTLVNNGSFSISIERCSNGSTVAQLTAVDMQAGQQGPPSNLTVTSGTYNAGTLSACGTSTAQYINYVLNGNPIIFAPPADTTFGNRSGTTTAITGYTPQNSGTTAYRYTSFSFSGAAAPGNYSLINLSIYTAPNMYTMSGSITTSITEYGNPGQYIAGSFSGNVKDSMGTTIYPITCNFRVKRGN
jgi:hypothetical protein